ncbi:MAG: hypothetical protein ACREFX_08250 [Opitutaceae bacterium]
MRAMRTIPVWLLAAVAALAARGADIAVYSKAFNGYTRTRLADHSFKPETYTFAEGAHKSGPYVDKSLDRTSFLTIARTLAAPLRARGYVPSFDPQHTDFVIFVFWGLTQGGNDGEFYQGEGPAGVSEAMSAITSANMMGPQHIEPGAGLSRMSGPSYLMDQLDEALMLNNMFNRVRDQVDDRNAALLGFSDVLERARGFPAFSSFQERIGELEVDRYYVILVAVDYNTLVRRKGYKLEWEAKMSLPARRTRFDKELALMARAGTRFYGENSDRLVWRNVPDGQVLIGKATVLGSESK